MSGSATAGRCSCGAIYPRETQEMVFDAHDRALVVGLREGHDDADRNYRQTRMLLGQHPDLAGIYNIGGAADGVACALKEMNRAHDVVFIGHGLTSDTRNLLIEGTMDAVITQNQLNTMMSFVGIFNNLRGGRAAMGTTVIGLTFNAVLEALERRFMRWKAPATA